MPVKSPEVGAALDDLFNQLASLAESSTEPRAETSQESSAASGLVALARNDELPTSAPTDGSGQAQTAFFPAAAAALADTGMEEGKINGIILRLLLQRNTCTGVEISQHIGLPFPMTEKLLQGLKADRLLALKKAATLSDYVYEITDAGIQSARRSMVDCSYCGAVPVSLEDYCASVAAQSLARSKPRMESLRRAFADLTMSGEMFFRLGRAITGGSGLFLHGPSGNGKSSIAERITAAFGSSIWIPRAISVWGEIIRLFDPGCHEELPMATGERIVADEKIDHRWVRIRRPTIIVGGELTLESLEITTNRETGVSEAPVQMKSNCGTLVVDDFGRQRVPPQKLLNRWIVPLEKRHDYLGLASGRKICVPFEQFVVFSTNMEPKQLVDEAFLRRIPYKIEVKNPSVEQFRKLFDERCRKDSIAFDAAALDHLIANHYDSADRPMRFCHARDLLHQLSIFCRLRGQPPAMSISAVEAAAKDYFSVAGH